MKKVSVSLEERHVIAIDDRQESEEISSRSEALRAILDDYEALTQRYEYLRTEYEDLETELERVKNEKRLILEDREEKQELVKYVEDERTAEQKWREAGLGTKLKWRLFGMDNDDD
jgi:metal-responsive CopG/Arc/MetJ family transcriptional regulator